MKIDFFFAYKYSLRFLISSKLGLGYCRNSYQVPALSKLYFFFSLVKSVDKHDASYYITFTFFLSFLASAHFYLSINPNSL